MNDATKAGPEVKESPASTEQQAPEPAKGAAPAEPTAAAAAAAEATPAAEPAATTPAPAAPAKAEPAKPPAKKGAPVVLAPVSDLDAQAEIKKLREQLLEARQALRQREAELEVSQTMGRDTLTKLKDQHERTLRAVADLDNHKKRVVREREETAKFGQEKLLKDFLPVLDNFDRALEHAKAATDLEAVKAGVSMMRKLFEDTLSRHGVKGFSALGEQFDPHRHEAVQTVESDTAPGTVVVEIVRGFTLHDRLMRPAMVAVAKPRAEAPSGEAGAAPEKSAEAPPSEAAEKTEKT